MKLINSYHALGKDFYQEINPIKVSTPNLVLWNETLAQEFMLPEEVRSNAASYLSGNQLLNGSIPLAQAYAGHQFGGFSPQLGDGRAHLLGELTNAKGNIYDLQLKGSGATKYSRRGDGRCALKPAIREFLMSEALHALRVPTTRSLSVVTTGETLYRGLAEPGAVVSRVASSHIRVGTFQYFSAKGDMAAVKKLLDYSINRHYPEISANQDSSKENNSVNGELSERIVRFLNAVIDSQISTVVAWMRVGFIHGVMNTDNMTISGETIDYGPCAMMGIYDPETVYSSIDEQGRYCFGNQPAILQWNMARLAESLLPLLGDDSDKAVALLEPIILGITQKYKDSYYIMMRAKLGLLTKQESDIALIDDLLVRMKKNRLDYTHTFIQLTGMVKGSTDAKLEQQLSGWIQQWKARLSTDSKHELLMVSNNPVVIARNHHVEALLTQCQESQAYSAVEPFLSVLRSPYKVTPLTEMYQDQPSDGDIGYRTYCGT